VAGLREGPTVPARKPFLPGSGGQVRVE